MKKRKRRLIKKRVEDIVQVAIATGIPGVKFIPTSPIPLSQVEVDLREISFEEAIEIIRKKIKKGSIAKINLTVTEAQIGAIDLTLLRKTALEKALYLRKIVPTIIRDFGKRIEGQNPELSKKEAVIHFLKAKNPKRKREIYKIALEIINKSND